MPTPSRKRRTNTTRRRALELLDASREGCIESVMLAHGFTVDTLVELVTARLATAQTEHMVAGGRRVERRQRALAAGNKPARRHADWK